MTKKPKRAKYYSPKIIGYYPRQVVALRLPANPDPVKAAEARRKQHQIAKSISSTYA